MTAIVKKLEEVTLVLIEKGAEFAENSGVNAHKYKDFFNFQKKEILELLCF